jgi:hypothetical protein
VQLHVSNCHVDGGVPGRFDGCAAHAKPPKCWRACVDGAAFRGRHPHDEISAAASSNLQGRLQQLYF